MQCRNCGTDIADKALICYRCGTATTEATFKPVPLKPRRGRPVGVMTAVTAAAALAAAVLYYAC